MQQESSIPTLALHHLRMLRDESGIADAVIAERGYRSIDAAEGYPFLKKLGFAKVQARRWPGLYIPHRTPMGQVAVGQYRPDEPRVDTEGKAIKYETPRGGSLGLDVPSRCLSDLKRADIRLWITEGTKKADAIASQGACALSLSGVWSFKHSRRILDEWDAIPLRDRQVTIIFDSDVMVKDSVQKALRALTSFLQARGVQVGWCYLEPGPEGEKIGIDDYLAQGGSLDKLEARIRVAEHDAQQRRSFREGAIVRRPTLHVQAVSAGEVKLWY